MNNHAVIEIDLAKIVFQIAMMSDNKIISNE